MRRSERRSVTVMEHSIAYLIPISEKRGEIKRKTKTNEIVGDCVLVAGDW